jgi:probable HAF family extracellular repeat protein
MMGLGFMDPNSRFSEATGVSADGSVIVGRSWVGLITEAFRWTSADGLKRLGPLDPNSPYSGAHDVSADGSVVVGISDREAFRWTTLEGMSGLGFLDSGDSVSEAIAASASALVVVGKSGIHAFRWTAVEGMVSLGGRFNDAFAVSADGSVIVGRELGAESHAFRWTAADGMQNLQDLLVGLGLDLTGWSLEVATGVSADGLTIVGSGTNPDGFQEGWVAHIPEPSTALLGALGVAATLVLRNRRRAD